MPGCTHAIKPARPQGIRLFAAPLPYDPGPTQDGAGENPFTASGSAGVSAGGTDAAAGGGGGDGADARRTAAQASHVRGPTLFEMAAGGIAWGDPHAQERPAALLPGAEGTSDAGGEAAAAAAAALAPVPVPVPVPRLNARATWLAQGAIFGDAVLFRARPSAPLVFPVCPSLL